MKTILLILLIHLSNQTFAQDSIHIDTLEQRAQLFNDSITKLLEFYESEEIDFIAIRSNVRYGPNCRFYIREDTCTRMFILYLAEEDLVGHIFVRTISSREPNDKRQSCTKELDNMYWALTDDEDYFAKPSADLSHYDPSKITFLGFVDGKYMFEVVEKEYFSTHHPGWFYETFRSSFH